MAHRFDLGEGVVILALADGGMIVSDFPDAAGAYFVKPRIANVAGHGGAILDEQDSEDAGHSVPIGIRGGETENFIIGQGNSFTNALASGETAVLEILWEGTQTGALATPGGELPASGRRVRIPAVQVIRVSGGKLQEGRHYFDMLGMLQQLGAVPGPAQASAGTSR